VSTPVVIHNRDLSRYEAHLDGALAGFADYKLTNSLIVFPHTEVDPAFGGQGVGGAIVQFALDDVRAAAPTRSCRCARSSRHGSSGTRTMPTWSTVPERQGRPSS